MQAAAHAEKVGTTEKVSTKYRFEERLEALMRMGGLRLTRRLKNGVLVATPLVGDSQMVAADAVTRTRAAELDKNIMRLACWFSCLANLTSLGTRDKACYETCGREGPRSALLMRTGWVWLWCCDRPNWQRGLFRWVCPSEKWSWSFVVYART